MKPIVSAIMVWAIFVISVHAEVAPKEAHKVSSAGSEPRQADADNGLVVTLKTRYGVVRYEKYGPSISVDGKIVWESSDDINDRLDDRGTFKLSNEEVILFENWQDGSTARSQGETFFLILKPNKLPEVVPAQIGPLENPILKTWQEKDVVYVDFSVDAYDEVKSPLKLVADKVVIAKAKPTLYSKNGPRLTGDDCSRAFQIGMNSCPKSSAERHEDCDTGATVDSNDLSLADSGYFEWLTQQPGFNGPQFDKSCMAWCKGQKLSYELFSKAACNIK